MDGKLGTIYSVLTFTCAHTHMCMHTHYGRAGMGLTIWCYHCAWWQLFTCEAEKNDDHETRTHTHTHTPGWMVKPPIGLDLIFRSVGTGPIDCGGLQHPLHHHDITFNNIAQLTLFSCSFSSLLSSCWVWLLLSLHWLALHPLS